MCKCGEAVAAKVRPVGNRILVKRMEEESAIKGGIILPDTAKTKQDRAIVLALGSGERNKDGDIVPFEIEIGDTVLIDKYAGQDITIDGQEFVIVTANEVLAIVHS